MPSEEDPPRKPASRLVLRAVLSLLAGCVVAAPFLQLRFMAHMDRGVWTDLYAPWVGTRAMLHGQNPYSAAVTGEIQKTIYGHVLQPTETWDRESFVYPAYIAFLLGPFTFLPWTAVHFLFGILAPFAVALTLWAWLRVLRLRTGPFATALIFALTLASWPAVWGYFQRQPSLFVAAAIAASVLLFQRGRNVAPGILLALATVKPQLVLLLGGWLLLQAVGLRRWRFVAAFALTLALLIGAATALLPHWIADWMHASAEYTRTPPKIPMLIFFFGRGLGLAAAIALVAALAVKLWKTGTVAPERPEFAEAVALILAATVCLMPENTWLVFNVLLILPALFLVFERRASGPLAGMAQALAGMILLLALIATPVCAVLGACLGFSLNLVLPPYLLNYMLPIPITAALLLTKSARVAQTAPLAPPPMAQMAS